MSVGPLEEDCTAKGAGAALEEHEGTRAAAVVPKGAFSRAVGAAAPPEHPQGCGERSGGLAAGRLRLRGLAGGAAQFVYALQESHPQSKGNERRHRGTLHIISSTVTSIR